MQLTSAAASIASITLVKAADVAVRALHAEAAWGAADPRPLRGAPRGTRVRREAVHRLSVVTSVVTSAADVVEQGQAQ